MITAYWNWAHNFDFLHHSKRNAITESESEEILVGRTDDAKEEISSTIVDDEEISSTMVDELPRIMPEQFSEM